MNPAKRIRNYGLKITGRFGKPTTFGFRNNGKYPLQTYRNRQGILPDLFFGNYALSRSGFNDDGIRSFYVAKNTKFPLIETFEDKRLSIFCQHTSKL